MKVFDRFKKKKEYLICIDSDGCAMDTMDSKHFYCFGPCMVEEWGLEEWREPILKRWNEINLYSMTRGINRFAGLSLALKEINCQYKKIDGISDLENWVEHSAELSNQALMAENSKQDYPILKQALSWSKAVNERIQQLPPDQKFPFSGVAEGLCAAHDIADIAIVSSANADAVKAEWEKHGLMEQVDICLTQNAGSKAFCIEKMLEQGYSRNHVLMVGDAPGDKMAAKKNGILFFPILVKQETESWQQFREEALSHFVEGTYEGDYQEEKIRDFEKNLSG